MGYEIKMFVGKQCLYGKELAKDTEHPFDDGSGFPYKRDADGNPVPTGRDESWFQIYAEIDLCKLGYKKDSLNTLIENSHDTERAKKETVYFFGTDGNTEIREDRYGSPMFPVPIRDVLLARRDVNKKEKYRRLDWAIALLESMINDPEELTCLFYGH